MAAIVGGASLRATFAAHAAQVEDARDRAVYLVTARGDGFVTRRVSRASLKAATCDGASLNLRFSDFTFPKAAIAFGDDAVARDWLKRVA